MASDTELEEAMSQDQDSYSVQRAFLWVCWLAVSRYEVLSDYRKAVGHPRVMAEDHTPAHVSVAQLSRHLSQLKWRTWD